MPALTVPECWSDDLLIEKNRARQLLAAAAAGETVSFGNALHIETPEERVRLVAGPASVPNGERALKVPQKLLREPDRLTDQDLSWIGQRDSSSAEEVRESLRDQFQFLESDPDQNIDGLRIPQVGAVHAVLGHWTTDSGRPGTVVMPTGTGKTEAMVAIFAAARIERLLVVVPSDSLRTQIGRKFETLGLLQDFGVIGGSAKKPVVGQIGHGFSSAESAREFAQSCNVVVTTPSALFASSPETQLELLNCFSHLFVDEAHHVEAPTWRQIREGFEGKPVLQFTATPYREDGRPLLGKLVYNFPLKLAQEQGYFSRINYFSVIDFESPDRAIAERAIEALRSDLADGRDHLVMARVRRIGRAREVRDLYEELAPDLNPVVVYSKLPAKERDSAIASMRSRESKIIVCVDMLGEGFDLPALKIAAIHDAHKSLGITLQFVGRFARVAGDEIGEAKVFVGRPDLDYDSNLRHLYSEDADWNLIVRDLSTDAIGEQENVSEFEARFAALPDLISLRNIEPKMSTVVYRTTAATWNPDGIQELFEEEQIYTWPIAINDQDRVAWFVTEIHSPVRWGDVNSIEDVTFDLYVLYWNEEQQLLYINSSNNSSTHELLARQVIGDSVVRVSGENVYRVMAELKRLVPTNVGLLDVYNRRRRFSMHVGADVTEGFPAAEAQTKTKTNIFAHGFDGGDRVSIGASLKGRIWSHRVAPTIKHWIDWCNHIGSKIENDQIDLESVMAGFVRPELLESRPDLVPLAIEWSWESLLRSGQGTKVVIGEESSSLVDVDLAITTFSKEGPIGFSVQLSGSEASYEIAIGNSEMIISPTGPDATFQTARTSKPLSEYLNQYLPTVIFEKEALLSPPAFLLRPNRDVAPYNPNNLRPIDWDLIDTGKEIQGPDRDPDSIQHRVVEFVTEQADWDVVIDDHGSGEIADVVAIRVEGTDLVISLTHCKKSSEAPGARTEDLYEVLGQAQKSVRWRRKPRQTIERLIKRERRRVQRGYRDGFEIGDASKLYELLDQAPLLVPSFSVGIAQPGLSAAAISDPVLELLGASETYIYETSAGSFEVICAP